MKILAVILFLFFCGTVNAIEFSEEAYKRGGFYEEIKCKITVERNRFKYSEKGTVWILNQKGENLWVLNSYESDFIKIGKMKVKVFDSDGKKRVEHHIEDFMKFCGAGSGYSLYEDICQYYYQSSGASYPYRIEFEFDYNYRSVFFLNYFLIQREFPVAETECVLDCLKSFQFGHRVTKGYVELVKESEKQYKWKGKNIPAINNEPMLLSVDSDPDRILFSPNKFSLAGYKFEGSTWKEIGEWYHNLSNGQYRLDIPEFNDSVDWKVSVQEEYEKVINNYRYVAVFIGIGGWQAVAPELTRKSGYGDCKALTNLLVANLREKGINANPALLLTSGNGELYSDFPSMNFNHVIAMAHKDGDTIWMDPTIPECEFGLLPIPDEKRYALIVTDTGGVLSITPESSALSNAHDWETRIHIESDLYMSLVATRKSTGNLAISHRMIVKELGGIDLVEFLNRQSSHWFSVTDVQVKNLEDATKPFQVNLSGESLLPVPALNGVMYFRVPAYRAGKISDDIDFDTRKYGIDMMMMNSGIERKVVTWSPEICIDSIILANPYHSENQFGTFNTVYSNQIDSLIEMTDWSSKSSTMMPSEFEAFRTRHDSLSDTLTDYSLIYYHMVETSSSPTTDSVTIIQ